MCVSRHKKWKKHQRKKVIREENVVNETSRESMKKKDSWNARATQKGITKGKMTASHKSEYRDEKTWTLDDGKETVLKTTLS